MDEMINNMDTLIIKGLTYIANIYCVLNMEEA